MSASVTWRNLDQFRTTLQQLPDTLSAEALGLLRAAAAATRDEVRAAYPVGETGNLVRGVTVRERKKGRWAGSVQVRSRAHHAWLFEHGTKPRQARFRLGKRMRRPANRGVMPAADIFVRVAIRHRQQLRHALKAVLERAGFEVSGG